MGSKELMRDAKAYNQLIVFLKCVWPKGEFAMSFMPIGTVMADKYGLARRATAIAVRVLDQNGSGTTM